MGAMRWRTQTVAVLLVFCLLADLADAAVFWNHPAALGQSPSARAAFDCQTVPPELEVSPLRVLTVSPHLGIRLAGRVIVPLSVGVSAVGILITVIRHPEHALAILVTAAGIIAVVGSNKKIEYTPEQQEEHKRKLFEFFYSNNGDNVTARFRSKMTRVIKKMCPELSMQDIEDVFQNALLKAYAGLEKFDGRCEIWTWLGAILMNEARTLRKKEYHRQKSIESLGSRLRLLDYERGIAHFEGIMNRRIIEETIAKIKNPQWRRVLSLTYLDGMEPGDVAVMLGITDIAFRLRLLRARLKFAKIVIASA